MTYRVQQLEKRVAISTHTLTWSVTKTLLIWANRFWISTHTLTWSVTRCRCHLQKCKLNFNSHAHVERDPFKIKKENIVYNFNSHAHVERDCKKFAVKCLTLLFQLTRSRGA